jgi:hypothetical protein
MAPVFGRIAVAAVLLLAAVLSLREIGSLDAGFHLAAGEWILSGNGWPRTDPFTFTVPDHAWVDTSWGYQVVLALAGRAAGAAGIVLLHVALVLAAFGTVFATARLVGGDRDALPALLLLGVLASEMRFEVRPELLSYALLAVVLHVLHRRDEGRPTTLWALPVVFLLWTNAHGLVVLGWGALACFLAGGWLRHGRLDRGLLAVSAASVGIGIVNPYGIEALTFPFHLATRFGEDNVFRQSIGELTSPLDLGLSERFPFYPRVAILAFRALAVLAALSVVPLVRARRWSLALATIAFGGLSLVAVRNMPLLALAALPAVASGLRPLERLSRLARSERLHAGIALATAAIALLVTVRVYHDAYYVATRRVDRFGLEWNRSALPVDLAEWSRRVGLTGRVLNHLDFGGYLGWAREQPVFVDGRLEVMGEAFFERYQAALASPDAMEPVVAEHGIEWVTFPYRGKPELLAALGSDPRWRLAYVDSLAVAFVRDGPGAAALVDPTVRALPAHPAPPDLSGLPGFGDVPRPSAAARWIAGLVRRIDFPHEPFHLGLFHLYRGEPAAAASRLAEAVRRSDGFFYETYNNLGGALYRLGAFDTARRCYEIVLDDAPDQRVAAERIAEIDARRGTRR